MSSTAETINKLTEKIIITNGYIDTVINSSIISEITKKQFTAKTSYWVFDKIGNDSKVYLSERKKLIEKYAMRYEADGETWKKGDIVSNGDSISLGNIQEFNAEMAELTEIEIDLGINKIAFDLIREPACTIKEMSLLIPLIAVEED